MDETICEEVLENIKLSLMQCKNNKTSFTLEKACDIKKCENIHQYQTSLYATNTKITIKIPDIVSRYSIQYDPQKRIVEIDN
jgi:hypothetical protein